MPTTPSPTISCSRIGARRVLRFGLEQRRCAARATCAAAPRARNSPWSRRRARLEVTLPLPGRHNVMNALAAAALALAAGAPLATIAAGLRAAQPVPGRQIAHAVGRRRGAGRRQLQRQPGSLRCGDRHPGRERRRSAGWCSATCANSAPKATRLHAEVGAPCARRRHRSACTRSGPLSARGRAGVRRRRADFRHRRHALIEALRSDLPSRAARLRVLVKGSRGSAMDRVVSGTAGADRGGDTACCLNSPTGCSSYKACSTCSTT